ncbi:MAG TPA: TonB-dependent receptor [Saprospiraceae bacterium]|nr:TonB-dependent receptor [Saprospiraceae bacterium]
MVAKTKIFNLLILIIITMLGNKLAAQQCDMVITGQVIDHHDDTSLEYATIFIQELDKGTVCDSNGYFIFENICPGKYHFIISHVGCESKNEYLNISETTRLTFFLEHHDEILQHVEITGQQSNSKSGNIRYTISKDIMFELNGRNLSEILTTIPGVNTLKAGPNLAKPIINGLYDNRITILNNGIPQEGQQWGNDHAPEIDPNTADKISIYKGASAIKYGLQALGGVVILEPNELTIDPHWHGDIRMNGHTNGRGIGIQGQLRNSSKLGNIRITLGHQISGDRKTPSYYLTNTGNTESSFSMLISNKKNEKSDRRVYYSFYRNKLGILRGSHIGNLTDLQEAFKRDIPFFTADKFTYNIEAPRQEVDHHLLKFSHKYRINDQKNIILEAGYQVNSRSEFDIRRGDRDTKPALDLLLFSQYYDLGYNYLGEHHSYTIGAQYRYVNNTNQPGTGILPLIPDYINNHYAIYLIAKKNLFGLELETGLRSEFRNYFVARFENRNVVKENLNFLNFAANVGLKHRVTNEITTHLDISYTNRPPEVNELFSNGLHQGVSGIEVGNPNLKPENSFKIVNEWTGHLAEKHYVNLSLFYNHINNFIYLQPQNDFIVTIRGAFPLFSYVGSDASMLGGSFKTITDINKAFQWTSGMSYIYARNLDQKTGLIRIPPLNAFSNIHYTIGKTSVFNELKMGLEASYTAMQNNVPIEEDFLLPPDDYFLINVSLRIKFKRKTNQDLDLSLRMENVFNTTYRDYLNRMRYFANEMGRNITFNIKTNF